MFWSNETLRTEGSASTDEPLSNQANTISNAMKEADKAMEEAFGANKEFDDAQSNELKDVESSFGDDETAKTGAATNANTHTTLNLKENDAQFLVFADVIVEKYGHFLKNGARSFSVSIADKEQLDRMVNRDSFVDAVRFRLRSCPENSMEPTHVAVRQCRALGLHQSGSQNPLFARAGTLISIEQVDEDDENTTRTDLDAVTTTTNGGSSYAGTVDTATQQQLMAELREASNLMADSVTPEAAQFWRRHVEELQTRLRIVEKSNKDSVSAADTRKLLYSDNKLLPLLCHNAGYVPPSDDELSQRRDIKTRSQISRPTVTEPTTNGLDPELEGIPMVDVVAPANLPEGYTFEAEIDGCRFMATVPAGGVKKGQPFTCYMRDAMNEDGAPTYRWRDGVFDCFRYGVCHPMALNSIFCPLLGLSQVMTRMGIDYMGLPAKAIPTEGPYSTRGVAFMFLGLWLTLNLIFAVVFWIKKKTGTQISLADIFACVIVNLCMYLYVVYATTNTRVVLRQRYRIKEFCCRNEVEDACCAAACMPCVVSQMGRHTVSYIEHRGVCCSDTGLEPGVRADITARSHQGSYRIW